jgi:hypothetical protein
MKAALSKSRAAPSGKYLVRPHTMLMTGGCCAAEWSASPAFRRIGLPLLWHSAASAPSPSSYLFSQPNPDSSMDSTSSNDSFSNESSHKNSSSNDSSAGSSSRADESSSSNLGRADGPRGLFHTSVSISEWERLRAPFALEAYYLQSRAVTPTAEARDDHQAIVEAVLRAEAVFDRLDSVLGPSRYSVQMKPYLEGSQPVVISCHIQIETASRVGLGQGSSLDSAREIALARAAVGFGIGRRASKARSVLAKRNHEYSLPDTFQKKLEQREDPLDWSPEISKPSQS